MLAPAQPLTASRAATLLADFDRSPAHAGITDAFKVLIGDGRVSPGTRLPSERELALRLQVSRTTVTRAYSSLRESGWAYSQVGSGTFSTVPGGASRAHDRMLRPADRPDSIDLNCAASSAPPGVAEAYAAALGDLPAYLAGNGYFPLGVATLREAIADTYIARGLTTHPEQIMITAGALAATSVVARALSAPGDRVLVEQPTYPNAVEAISLSRARLTPVGMDEDGWDVDGLEDVVRRAPHRAAYLIPDFQNPTGHLMTDPVRERLAAILRRHGTVPVIDEAHQSLGLDLTPEEMPRPFAEFAPASITIGSASKSHWGGMRLGWIRAPHAMMDRLLTARTSLDLGAPVSEQLALVHLLRNPDVIEATRHRLRHQRDTLLTALRTELPDWTFRVPRGGLSVWCRLPAPLAPALAGAASRRGVEIAPGPVFSVTGGLASHVRLPWTRPEGELLRAVAQLAQAWQETLRNGNRPAGAQAPTGRMIV